MENEEEGCDSCAVHDQHHARQNCSKASIKVQNKLSFGWYAWYWFHLIGIVYIHIYIYVCVCVHLWIVFAK